MDAIGIILAILVFSLIIAFHELGHFLAAKSSNVKVNEFAIGMGPKIFSKKKGETVYSIRAIPFGGFCAMEGEDGNYSEENTDEDTILIDENGMEIEQSDRSFGSKSILTRMKILVAGAFFNLVLGLIVVFIMSAMQPYFVSTQISGFNENASSQSSGLMVGDKIVEVDGMTILTDDELVYALLSNHEAVYDMVVERDGEKVKIDDVVMEKNGENLVLDFSITRVDKTFAGYFTNTFTEAISIGRLVWISLGDLITGQFGLSDISGPVGIVSAIGQTVTAQQGADIEEIITDLLNITAMITINVGFVNLLPLPALDGGRILFLIIEAIRRKPIKPEHEGIVHFAGLVILLGFIAVVTFNDIAKLIGF